MLIAGIVLFLVAGFVGGVLMVRSEERRWKIGPVMIFVATGLLGNLISRTFEIQKLMPEDIDGVLKAVLLIAVMVIPIVLGTLYEDPL